jgi:aspartate/methionine/tyrosine aminotransferase
MVRQLSARAQVIVAAAATCGVAVLAAALTLMPSPAAAKARSKRPKRKRKKNDKNDSLSSRGSRLTRPALPYMGGVLEGFAEPYDAATGKGVILLAVAENKLCWPRLKPRVEAALAQVPDWTANYGPMDGGAQLKGALARFLDRRIIRDDRPRVVSDHVSCAAGAAACLNNLFLSICEAGDSVLIPAPYYAAFDADLGAICALKRIPVRLRQGDFALTRSALDKAYAASGQTAKALLLTNPHNPTGRCLTEDELRLAVGWCDSKKMHLVSDEVYALSMLKGDAFVSLGKVTKGALGDRRHIVWGLSKDFGMSGLRFGCVWTQNDRLRQALGTAAMFGCVPGVCQAMVTELLLDDAFCDDYLRANQVALRLSCAACTAMMDALSLPYYVPDAGMFLWCDLSSLLDEKSWAAEARLYDQLRTEIRVVLTPGEAQHAAAPGWFRICYAFVGRDVLDAALSKFQAWVERRRA